MLHPIGGIGQRFILLAAGRLDADPAGIPDPPPAERGAPISRRDRPCVYVFGALGVATGRRGLVCVRVRCSRSERIGSHRVVGREALARYADVIDVGLTHPTQAR